jgi:hypothetical protein
MKRVLLILCLLFSGYTAFSQIPSFGKWNLEAGFAESFSSRYSVDQYSEAYNAANYRLYIETRYHCSDNIALGVQASYYGHDKIILHNDGVYGGSSGIIRNSQYALVFVADWNVSGSGNLSPFLGVETGWSYVGKSSPSSVEKDNRFVINPRIGLDIYKHFRIGAGYFFTVGDRDNSYFAIRAGVYL